jgi:hypothetical protein
MSVSICRKLDQKCLTELVSNTSESAPGESTLATAAERRLPWKVVRYSPPTWWFLALGNNPPVTPFENSEGARQSFPDGLRQRLKASRRTSRADRGFRTHGCGLGSCARGSRSSWRHPRNLASRTLAARPRISSPIEWVPVGSRPEQFGSHHSAHAPS